MDSKLERYLLDHKINYDSYKHEPVFTVEDAKKIKKDINCIVAKSLFLKSSDSKFFLICLPGEKHLNIKKLKKLLNIKKLKFASEKELSLILKVTPGSVSIFCLIHSKETILVLDKDLWKEPTLAFHPNINTETLLISHEDLKKFYDSLKLEKHIIDL